MKNLSIILLLVVLLFGMVFAAYIIAFKSYFSSNKLIGATKHLSRMTFQRDVKVSDMSFSPFGTFKMRSFSMAAKGGFDNGTLIGINKIIANIKPTKLIKRELYIRELSVDGINLRLNYENKRKFDYVLFFSNARFILMEKGKRIGLMKKVEIKNITIKNVSIDLMLDAGKIEFKNLVLMSEIFDSGNNFDGDISFDFEFNNKQYKAFAKFNYDTQEDQINISDLTCKEFSLSANGKISFLDRGRIALDFIASADRSFFDDFLSVVTGENYLENIKTSSQKIENIKIFYSNGTDINNNDGTES